MTRTTYGNGAATTRVFDPKTGRATDIDTAASGGTKIQDNAYAWRSDGLLASRASHVGGTNAKLEEFAYDPLGRLKTATTKLSNVTRRTLSQTYDANGNLKTKTSSVGADIGVSAYGYDASKPHRLASATIGGKAHAFSHDADGNIKKYDCTSSTCVDDKYIDWNGRNLPERITVGGSRTDATPTSRDEFAYGPDGARYHRKTSHMDGETLRAENTYYLGAFEELLPGPGAAHTSIKQTRVTDSVRHVKTTAVRTTNGKKETVTASYVDYLHKDHLGSVEGVTGANGARTRELAYDPFGGRRKADWTAALTESERLALAGSSDPRTRGHTGHEHLDRTGLIHRGGRVYDPTLGRFLSPDPLVGNPGSAQSWNGYSYVSNSPMSFADPSGLSQAPARPGCVLVGFSCRGQGGGAARGGFGVASVVSTYRYRYVDVFVSVRVVFGGIYGGGNGPGVLDGWWDFMDPFVELYYEYIDREGSVQVTSQVGMVATPNVTGEDIDIGGEIAPLEDVTEDKRFPAYKTQKGTIIQINSTATKLPTGDTLEALITFVDETGLETVVITGGSEVKGHSVGSYHGKNLAIDVAGPRFNELTNETVQSAAKKAGFTHGVYEDYPGTRRDHWHLQIGAGHGLDDRYLMTNPQVVTKTYQH